MGIEGIQRSFEPIKATQTVREPDAVRQLKTSENVKKEPIEASGKIAALDAKQRTEPVKEDAVIRKPAENNNQAMEEKKAENTDKKVQNVLTEAKFSYNKEIDRIIITISDRASDKVIKEIPPEDTQRMLEKIHVMTGMVMDEGI